MVNFRYHLVSLTAVFLALALGITMGATVVDRATVDLLQRRLDVVSENATRTNGENDRLRGQLERWDRFAREAGEELVDGRLQGVPVFVVAVQGVERPLVDALESTLLAAGATLEGTVWLTSRLQLQSPQDVRDLAAILGVGEAGADGLRRAAIGRLATSWAAPQTPNLLVPLTDARFAEYEPPPEESGAPPATVALPLPGTRFVVVSGADARVDNAQVAIPLAGGLAQAAPARVLAAEPGQEAGGGQRGKRAHFVGALRQDEQVAARLSTLDTLEDFKGRVAAVLAMEDLGLARVGHYGLGPGARRLVPEPR